MGFSRQEYWSGLPFPSPGDPPDPGIEPGSPSLQEDYLLNEPPVNQIIIYKCFKYKNDSNQTEGINQLLYAPYKEKNLVDLA